MTQQENGGAGERGVIPWPLRKVLDDAEARGFSVDWQEFIDECNGMPWRSDALLEARSDQ